MASDTMNFLTTVAGGSAHLVGWSDGAIVALLVGIARPDLVRKLVVIGGAFDVSGYLPEAYAMFDGMAPDDPHLAELRALYDAASPDGSAHWVDVVAKLKDMFRREPHIALTDLGRISARTLVMAGDDDLCSMDHTIALCGAIPKSELAVGRARRMRWCGKSLHW
jgi:pimeloyl-ACP methyl ester carboxylesterase